MAVVICSGRVFHRPGRDTLDGVVLCDDGIKRSQYGRSTLEQLKERYGPTVEEGDLYVAIALIEDAHTTEPVEIDGDRWTYFLEVLPPNKWVNQGETESFQSVEYQTFTITQICVRVGDRRFAFDHRHGITHTEAVEKVRNSTAYAAGLDSANVEPLALETGTDD
jgi:hypothetical protein